MPELRFDNRVAIVTGGGRGLGRAYALLLGSKGAKVVVNDVGGSLKGEGVDAGPAEEVVREIKKAGGDAVAVADSIADPHGPKAIVDAAMNTWGKVDILIHNAGNVRRGMMNEISDEDFFSVLNVHLHGAYNVSRRVFPEMLKNKYGRIVMTSSIGGTYGNPNIVNYAVAKAGLIGLSNVMAIEGLAHNVKSNVILPGAATRMAEGRDTSMFPSTMHEENVAPVVGWMVHESCSITGEMLIAMAGRVGRAYIAETPGVFREHWTMEDVAKDIDAIRATDKSFILPTLTGFNDHIGYSFKMAFEHLPKK